MPTGIYLGNKGRTPWNKGKKRPPFSEEWKRKIGEAQKGKKHAGYRFTPEQKAKVSAGLKGKRTGEKCNFWKGGVSKRYCIVCGVLIKNWYAQRCVVCVQELKKGSGNPMWKGGITPEHQMIRTSAIYKNWRLKVFERDEYTCQICGIKGGYLEADHIKSFAHHPELRFELSNGRTLCKPCHKTTDTYGGKIKNYAVL